MPYGSRNIESGPAIHGGSNQQSLVGRYIMYLNMPGAAALERAVLDCWRLYPIAPDIGNDGGVAVMIQPVLDGPTPGQ